MNPSIEQPAAPVRAVLPDEIVRTPSGEPAALVVRTSRGWTVLHPDPLTGCAGAPAEVQGHDEPLTLIEAMSLADLVADELGATPEPDRKTRRAARAAADTVTDAPPADPRDEEIAGLHRIVGQLEHALAARVSIERAIGALAERHGTTPREAFEELRRRARSQGRPAQELAAEVLDALTARAALPDARLVPAAPLPPGPTVLPTPGPRVAGTGPSARRVQRNPQRTGGSDTVPGARS
jgi:hypothetical protein